MLRKKAVKMPKEDNLTLPHISKMLSNLFGKEGHLQSPSSSFHQHHLIQCQLSNSLKLWRGGLNKFQQETWKKSSKKSSRCGRKYPIIHMITQFNLANCVTTKFQINPERRGVCVHTIQNNITFLTSAKRDCNGWVVFMTLTKNYFLTDCKIVIYVVIFDKLLHRDWILKSRLDHWTTTENKIREKTTALGLRRQQNVSLWGSHQPTSFSTDF